MTEKKTHFQEPVSDFMEDKVAKQGKYKRTKIKNAYAETPDIDCDISNLAVERSFSAKPYSIESEETITSLALAPNSREVAICQLKPRGLRIGSINFPRYAAKLVSICPFDGKYERNQTTILAAKIIVPAFSIK